MNKPILASELGFKVGTANYMTAIELSNSSETEITSHFNDILYKNVSCKFSDDEEYMEEFEERIVMSPKKYKMYSQNGYKISIFIGFIKNKFSLYIEDEGELIVDAKYENSTQFWDDVFKYIKRYKIQEQC